jgi:hypothetical protein
MQEWSFDMKLKFPGHDRKKAHATRGRVLGTLLLGTVAGLTVRAIVRRRKEDHGTGA